MHLTRVILGPVQTEKSERSKLTRVHALRVAPTATKIDVKAALERHFGVNVASVRMLRVRSKMRNLGAGKAVTRRHAWKKAMVTLTEKSKNLDLASFQTQ